MRELVIAAVLAAGTAPSTRGPDPVINPTGVNAAQPLTKTGTTLSCLPATATDAGCLLASDWSTFNSKLSSVSVTAPIATTGGSSPTLSCIPASGVAGGCLTTTAQVIGGRKGFDNGINASEVDAGSLGALLLQANQAGQTLVIKDSIGAGNGTVGIRFDTAAGRSGLPLIDWCNNGSRLVELLGDGDLFTFGNVRLQGSALVANSMQPYNASGSMTAYGLRQDPDTGDGFLVQNLYLRTASGRLFTVANANRPPTYIDVNGAVNVSDINSLAACVDATGGSGHSTIACTGSPTGCYIVSTGNMINASDHGLFNITNRNSRCADEAHGGWDLQINSGNPRNDAAHGDTAVSINTRGDLRLWGGTVTPYFSTETELASAGCRAIQGRLSFPDAGRLCDGTGDLSLACNSCDGQTATLSTYNFGVPTEGAIAYTADDAKIHVCGGNGGNFDGGGYYTVLATNITTSGCAKLSGGSLTRPVPSGVFCTCSQMTTTSNTVKCFVDGGTALVVTDSTSSSSDGVCWTCIPPS